MDQRPYSKYENMTFSNVRMTLGSSDFEEVVFRFGEFTFSFNNCSFESFKLLNTEDINFEDITVRFSDCKIKSIQIEKIISSNISVLFYNCDISGSIKDSNLKYVQIKNCFSSKPLFFRGLNKVQISYNENCNIPIKFKAHRQLYLIESCTDVTYYTTASDFEEEDSLLLISKEREILDVSLDLRYTLNKEHRGTWIEGAALSALNISGIVNGGELKVSRSTIDNIYIRDFSISGKALFIGVKPSFMCGGNKLFEINQSNLDNIWFDKVDFKEYDFISIYQSFFGQSKFTSCRFPDNYNEYKKFISVEDIHSRENKEADFERDRYEMFIQLKKTLETSGNFFEAQKLHSISNEVLLKINNVSGWDKLILRLNSISNNHGDSIKRPLLWILLISICLYILYLVSLSRIFINAPIDWNLVGYYFSFLDITHRVDFLVEKNELTGWSIVIDWVNKIVIGFLLYQFIAAFRKYGKR